MGEFNVFLPVEFSNFGPLSGDYDTVSSYGRRRRRREVGSRQNSQVKVASVIFINDSFKKSGDNATDKHTDADHFTSSLDWAADSSCDIKGSSILQDHKPQFFSFFDKVIHQAFFNTSLEPGRVSKLRELEV